MTLPKHYYPTGYQPIHEVRCWCKVRRILRALRSGEEVPPFVVDGGTGGSLITGTHRAAANDLARMLGWSERVGTVELEEVLEGLDESVAERVREAVESGDFEELNEILDTEDTP